jgi:hypothetical protein
MISNLFYKNNAFAYVQLDSSGNFQAIYPIDFSRLELLEHKNEVYTQFHFLSGNKLTLPYSEVIHLRRFFYKHDIYGDMDNSALQKSLDLLHTTDEGIANAIKSSAYLRGLIRFQNSMLSPKDMKDSRDKFVEDLNDDGLSEIGIANWNGGKAPCASSAIIFTVKDDSLQFLKKQQINTEFSRFIYPRKNDFKNSKYKDSLCIN